MPISYSESLQVLNAGLIAPNTGVWVQFVSNNTGTAYVSDSFTDSKGVFTFTIKPPGDSYTVNTGPLSTGPWTLFRSNWNVPVVQGENPSFQSTTEQLTGPYVSQLPSGDAIPAGVETGRIYDTGGEVVNVANYCIVDGVTDQIIRLQALVDAVAAAGGNARSKRLWFPGQVAISTPLLLKDSTYSGLQFAGSNRLTSGVNQLTNSTACIKTLVENIHSVVFQDFGMRWANNQTTAHTNSYGISFNATAGTLLGWYYWYLNRVLIQNPYVGLGFQGTGSLSVWSNVWDDILFGAVRHNLINLTAPIVGGQPRNVWRKLVHINGGVATGDDYAIRGSALEVTCHGLDLEDWANTGLITLQGGGIGEFKGIHIERWTGSIPGTAFQALDIEPIKYGDVEIVASTPDATAGTINLFGADNAASGLTVEGLLLSGVTIATPANWKTVRAVAGAKLWLRDLVRNGGTVVPIIPADAITQAAVVQYDATFGGGLAFGPGISVASSSSLNGPAGPWQLAASGINAAQLDTGPRFYALGSFNRTKQTPTEAVLVSGVSVVSGDLIEATLTAARVVGAPTGMATGALLLFTLIQGGAGAFAVTWNAVFKVSWSDAGNATGKRSSIEFWYDGTNWNQVGAQAPYV